jgi:hypothetical protein
VNPFLGFRFWFPRNGRLYPLRVRAGGAAPWQPGINDATCDQASHAEPPPGDTCMCGLHSFYELDWMIEWLKGSPVWEIPESHPRGRLVLGITRNWGRLSPGRQTMAAQHAEIIALLDWPDHDDRKYAPDLSELAWAYGVPIVALGAADAWAAEFGVPMPDHLKPAGAAPPS